MKFYNKNSSGYSLVEVLVAVSVLLIALVGPLTIASKGLKNASLAKQQNIAFFLAQEGIEGIIKEREDNALQAYIVASSTDGVAYDVWDIVSAIEGLYCTAETPCGIEVEEDNQIFPCEDFSCDLYLHDDGRARYRHEQTGGEPTPYHRELILNVDDSRVHVRSIVTWGSDEDKRVELESYVYNIYAN